MLFKVRGSNLWITSIINKHLSRIGAKTIPSTRFELVECSCLFLSLGTVHTHPPHYGYRHGVCDHRNRYTTLVLYCARMPCSLSKSLLRLPSPSELHWNIPGSTADWALKSSESMVGTLLLAFWAILCTISLKGTISRMSDKDMVPRRLSATSSTCGQKKYNTGSYLGCFSLLYHCIGYNSGGIGTLICITRCMYRPIENTGETTVAVPRGSRHLAEKGCLV